MLGTACGLASSRALTWARARRSCSWRVRSCSAVNSSVPAARATTTVKTRAAVPVTRAGWRRRQRRFKLPRRREVAAADTLQHHIDIARTERWLARQQVIEGGTEAVDVA